MKKQFFWVLLIVAATVGGYYWYKSREAGKEKKIQIGAILPLSGGGSADAGNQLKNAFEMFKEEYNVSALAKIEIEYGDSKNNAADGLSVYNKMNKLDGIKLFIASNSGVVVPLSKEISKNKDAVLMTTINSASGVPESGDNIFRVFVSVQNETKTMATFIKNKLKKEKVAVLYINDDFGISGFNTFEQNFQNVEFKSTFEKTGTDFKDIVNKVPKDVDVVYVIGYENALGIIIKQLREYGYKNTIVSTIGMSIANWRANAGNAAEGVIYTGSNFNVNSTNKEVQEFCKKFESKYNKPPTSLNVYGYYSIKILVESLAKCDNNSIDCIKKSINNSTHESIMGTIKIDNVGEADLPLSLYTFKNGKEELLEERQ